MKKKQTTFDELFIEYYQGIMLFGIVMIAIGIWLYEYHYAVTSDDLVGVLAACSLFFGILILGQGIRGWRDGEEFRNRYVKMKSRRGAELEIRKKKKRNW
jgi:hypothetical protein